MLRKIELFVRKGVVKKQAIHHNDPTKAEFGEILVFNQNNPNDKEPLTIYTHPLHSFSKSGSGPEAGKLVYFFMFPFEYIGKPTERPAEKDSMLAVNVLDSPPYLSDKKGHVKLKRQPCGTTLTINPEQTSSYNQFIVNDYGELFILHTKGDFVFSPWVKIILDEKDFPAGDKIKFTRSHARRIGLHGREEHKLLTFNLKIKSGNLNVIVDPSWEWLVDGQPIVTKAVIQMNPISKKAKKTIKKKKAPMPSSNKKK